MEVPVPGEKHCISRTANTTMDFIRNYERTKNSINNRLHRIQTNLKRNIVKMSSDRITN
jgi:hypothetical protein